MNRRHFLSAVTAAIGGLALDPELPAPLMVRSEMSLFSELPSPINDLVCMNDRLFAMAETGLFEVFGDGTFKQISIS